jgi:outer membrane protein, heavy metal efflux system
MFSSPHQWRLFATWGWFLVLFTGFFVSAPVQGQEKGIHPAATRSISETVGEWASPYVDPVQGTSSSELVRRALSSNAELAAARLEIERVRARLKQVGLRQNPTLDFEQTNGVLNSPGESVTSVGISVPLELGGKRQRRVDLTQAEFAAAAAEVADRERRLANEVRAAYAEAISALRELSITAELNNVDTQTARVVEARVSEGDAAPLELNLPRVEIERLRSRRALIEGRLQAALLKLKSLTGIPAEEPLRLREGLSSMSLPVLPSTLEAATNAALDTRPDLKLAKLTEEVAEAGYKLAQAQASPEVTVFGVTRSTNPLLTIRRSAC